jgi:hypothetical protein
MGLRQSCLGAFSMRNGPSAEGKRYQQQQNFIQEVGLRVSKRLTGRYGFVSFAQTKERQRSLRIKS